MSDHWELVSERLGGSVSTLLSGGDAGLLALTTAAVHQSSDGGATWSTLSAGRLASPLNAIAQSGASLFVGGQSGVARSRDRGLSWSDVLADATVVCLGMTRDGERSGRSEVLAGTDADGLLRSEDDGATWTSANPGLLDPTVLCLASTPGSTSFAGTPTGMYRSGNAGRSWREVELPCGPVGVECLAASDELVLAGTDAAGAFASRDEGRSWSRVAGLAASAVTALSIGGGHGLLAVGSPDGVHVSRDGGATWHIDPIGTVLSLAWLPDCLLAGVAGDGVLRLDGTSRQWQPSSSGLHGRLVVDLAWSPQTDTLLTADLEAGVQRSNDSGRTWQFAHEGPPGASHVAVGSDVVYAATTGGLFTSRDAGLTWSVVRAGAACIAVATTTAGEALAAFDDSRVLMVGSDGRERCVEWDVARGRIQSVALLDGDMLFVGTVGDRSVVWRSIDSGQSWAAWFQAEPVPALCMALSGRPDRLLIGAGSRVFRAVRNARERAGSELRPLWLSTPLGESVTSVAFGATPAIVYAASSSGVHRSVDGGEHFSRWSEGLPPDIPVLALQATPQGIYALGFGGTLWRLSPG